MKKSLMMKILGVAAVVMMLSLVIATPASAKHHRPDREVPIKGTVVGVHDRELPDPPDEPGPVPGCPDGTSWRFFSSGTGQMSHLGRVDYQLTQCAVFNPETLRGTFDNGTIRFTAANGDELVIAQRGSFEVFLDFASEPPEPIGFIVEDTSTWDVVAGGSGRFTHAAGSGLMDGIGDVPDDGEAFFNLPDGAAVFNFEGWISYDASDRSTK